ncbi:MULTISPECIES: hypothetical protein [Bradyrhizobium]|uniref:hypothetical protein n=1 Tax=Bradyrhizobium pachyrhizi TaxID=280333 RepID=UPI00040B233B
MHFIFRFALVLSPILLLSPAGAASPEDRYIAARDAAIAKFAKLSNDNRSMRPSTRPRRPRATS